MKLILSILLILSGAGTFGQKDALPDLKSIETIDQANALIKDFPDLKAYIYIFNAKTDISEDAGKILKSEKGDVLKLGKITYKILDTGDTKVFRVSYIYLDGSQLSHKVIDSLRKQIISSYKKGTPFDALAGQFTMDGNTSGDTGYFGEGTMVAEFEQAVRRHRKGDVFTVDIPSHNWYHIVKKTYADREYKAVKVLVIPGF